MVTYIIIQIKKINPLYMTLKVTRNVPSIHKIKIREENRMWREMWMLRNNRGEAIRKMQHQGKKMDAVVSVSPILHSLPFRRSCPNTQVFHVYLFCLYLLIKPLSSILIKICIFMHIKRKFRCIF